MKTKDRPLGQLLSEAYEAPAIEVMDIAIEQNILAGSGYSPDFDGEDW